MFANLWRSLRPQPEPAAPLTPNLEPYRGPKLHALRGLLVGPSTEIIPHVRFMDGRTQGRFAFAERNFKVKPLDGSHVGRVLRAFAFEHSIRNTGGWCPTQLTLEGGEWTTDTRRLGGIVDEAYRCWFDCQKLLFTFRKLADSEEPRIRKATRLLVDIDLASTKGGADTLTGRIYDGDRMEAELLCNGRLLRTLFVEDWEGAEASETPAQRVEGLWLWRLHRNKCKPLEKLGEQRFRCFLGDAVTPVFGSDTFRVEIDLEKEEAQVYASGLGMCPILRSTDGLVEIQARFRHDGGHPVVRFYRNGKSLPTTHHSSSTSVGHSGSRLQDLKEIGPWYGSDGLGLELLGKAKAGKILELSPDGQGGWSCSYSERGCYHDVSYGSEYQFSLNSKDGTFSIKSSSHTDMS